MQVTCPSCGELADRVYEGMERKTYCQKCGWNETAISTSIVDGLPEKAYLTDIVKWCLDTNKKDYATWLLASQEEATVSFIREFLNEYADHIRIINEIGNFKEQEVWELTQDIIRLERKVAQLECDNLLRAEEIAQDRRRMARMERELASLRRLMLELTTPEDLEPEHILRRNRGKVHAGSPRRVLFPEPPDM